MNTEIDLAHQDWIFNSSNAIHGFAVDEKEAVWVPHEPGTSNRLLMLDLNTNSFATILRCEPGSGLARHYHSGTVSGFCLQGSWKYKENDWVARPGTYIYERPGEAHTLQILGNEIMMTFFYVNGPHITLDEEGRQIGYVDAFRILEFWRTYYQENGLDPSYLDKITR